MNIFGSTQKIGGIQLILFGGIWAAFGIFPFFMIDHWGREYARKMELVNSGKVPMQPLYVISINEDTSDHRQHHQWSIGLSPMRKPPDPRNLPVYKTVDDPGDLAIGKKVPAYFIEGQWFIPRFFTGGWNWGKWAFLSFGLVPPLSAAAIALIVRKRRQSDQNSHAAPTPPLPEAYSKDRLHFVNRPSDEELLALLGSSNYSSLIKVTETPTMLSARAGLIPMRYVVPWMVFVLCLITASPWILPRFGVHVTTDAIFWGAVAAAWVVVVPVMFAILAALNRYSAGQKDYFQADLNQRTLALPQSGITVPVSRIDSMVVIKRWAKFPSDWEYVAQTAVLVRDEREEFDYYPVLQDRQKHMGRQKTLSDRLAQSLGLKVREITRTQRESRQLKDSPV